VLRRRFLIVMEFRKGVALSDCSGADYFEQKEDASDGDAATLLSRRRRRRAPTLSQIGARILREIGAICAFDVLCNNTDRLPLLANNRGNPDNIMLPLLSDLDDDETAPVVAIDNTITCIDAFAHADQVGFYCCHVVLLL
jgi:hypothetical protein